mgnify:CR=1 FL=1
MNKEQAILEMLGMYLRAANDSTLRSYLKVCATFSNEEVVAAVKYLIAHNNTLPFPRALAKELSTATRNKGDRRKACEYCNDAGWYYDNRETCTKGLKNHAKGTAKVCKMRCTLAPNHPSLTPLVDVATMATAQIYGQMIAEGAVDGNAIKTPADWGRYMWDRKTFEEFCAIAKRYPFRVACNALMVRHVLKVGECQSDPVKAAKRLAKAGDALGPLTLFGGA